MARRSTVKKPSIAQLQKWIEAIRTLQDQIAEYGLPKGQPLEEAYYDLDAAVERMREVQPTELT